MLLTAQSGRRYNHCDRCSGYLEGVRDGQLAPLRFSLGITRRIEDDRLARSLVGEKIYPGLAKAAIGDVAAGGLVAKRACDLGDSSSAAAGIMNRTFKFDGFEKGLDAPDRLDIPFLRPAFVLMLRRCLPGNKLILHSPWVFIEQHF